MSSDPIWSAAAWICAALVTSRVTGVIRGSGWASGWRVPAYTRVAPLARASATSACPMPRLAPVTRTVLSSIVTMMTISFSVAWGGGGLLRWGGGPRWGRGGGSAGGIGGAGWGAGGSGGRGRGVNRKAAPPARNNGPARFAQKCPCAGTWVAHRIPAPTKIIPAAMTSLADRRVTSIFARPATPRTGTDDPPPAPPPLWPATPHPPPPYTLPVI